MLVEIQALVCQSNFGIPRRQAAGWDFNRLNLLMAVLEKRAGIHLGDQDAYVNIAGGMRISEPAIDLAIVMALASSYKNSCIDQKTVIFGEVGLAGEVRSVTAAEQRVREAAKLGFTRCILPASCIGKIGSVSDIQLIGVANVSEAMELL